MNKFMRMIVFFDLPVKTKVQRKIATQFRNFLLKDGYFMVQYSVYCRVCNGYDDVEKHKVRIRYNKPNNGSVRLLVITEKQYEKMELIIGNLVKEEEYASFEQLSIF
ncbi:MAG: CRISPR-associated endonuclease Cas2 [Ruminococcus sp.]|nr:CRISPR-associated endonuclease Cas2 [Ruminococcus sp.]